MTHNFTKSPADTGPERKLHEAKDRTHSLPFLRKRVRKGRPLFQHSRSPVIGRRQSHEAKVDQKVCKSILHPDLTRFNDHIPENLHRILRGSPVAHPPGSHLRSFDQNCRTVETLNRASIGQYCLQHVPELGKHIESTMVRAKGRARELILHNIQ